MSSNARKAEERVAPNAAIVYEAIHREGSDELKRPSSALFWSGMAAGLSMGFSLLGEALLRAALPDVPWRPLITKLGYPIGFIIVILGRQQLFTENTLTPILPLLDRKDVKTLVEVARLWSLVLVANTAGGFVFGWLLAHAPIVSPEATRACGDIARDMLSASATEHLVRAVFAGWLIALVVWLLPFAESARVFVIIIITFIIGLAHFDHIIAGTVTMFFAGSAGIIPLGTSALTWWLPTFAGNIIGGVLLVAALNHAQVTAGTSSDA